MAHLLDRYADRIAGVLSCYDRILLYGTLPGICYLQGMSRFLERHQIPVDQYYAFVGQLRDRITAAAHTLATAHGIPIEYIRKASIRKEAVAAERLAARGGQPGLVCILSAQERCEAYERRHSRRTGTDYLVTRGGKCLHYYFYFLDEELGLCHVRVPTWCPFRLQFYFNGHGWLAARLRAAGVAHTLRDNAFVELANCATAQQLADQLDIPRLHAKLDDYARRCCPVAETFGVAYHWSVSQAEYATDLLFRTAGGLRFVYDLLSRAVILAVKPDRVAAFFGRTFESLPPGEIQTQFLTRRCGTCVKHVRWPVAVKMYDKMAVILRIETTVDDISFFRHHRQVEQKDGSSVVRKAPFRKFIYSLPALAPVLAEVNRRYLDFLSELDDPSAGARHLDELGRPTSSHGRSYRGLNLFAAVDLQLLRVIGRAEFMATGLRNRYLRELLGWSSGQASRWLKNLRLHRLIRKAPHGYKYYLTDLGRRGVAAALLIREFTLIPCLAGVPAAGPNNPAN
jgi:hypothetical protein